MPKIAHYRWPLSQTLAPIARACRGAGRRHQRGQVMVLTVLGLGVMMAMMAMAIDVGYMWHVKRRMQTAADAAALAGAAMIQGGSSAVVVAADEDATLNGFTNGNDGVVLTVNYPPQSGPDSGNSDYVETILSQPQNTFFLNLLGIARVKVGARAVAYSENAPGCVYVLDHTAQKAMSLSGGVSVAASCGTVVDSSNTDALDVTGGSVLHTSAAGVAGQAQTSGGGTIVNLTGQTLTPKNGIVPVPDPLAAVIAPTVGGCTYTGTQNLNAYLASQTPPYSGNYTISPGTYCGGIKASNGTTITLNPGTYILAGGGLSVETGGTFNGSGVTFYDTTGAAAGYGGASSGYGPITFTGGTVANLSAPTNGPLAGILFFQDRNVSSGAASNFSGGTNMNLAGALYFSTTQLNYSGGSNAAYTIIVADTLNFTGGATLNSDYSSLANGSPIKGAVLSE
ncbi:MAG: pilus assembly protein TadG-related protein [Candidatus Binataceae bacterium]